MHHAFESIAMARKQILDGLLVAAAGALQ